MKFFSIPLIALTYISLFSLGLIDSGRGPSYPYLLKEFEVGPKWGSFFFVLTSFTGLLINLSTFFWLPKIGPIRTLKFSLLIISIASFLIGSSGFVREIHQNLSLVFILLGPLLLGPGAAGLSISMNIIIPKLVSKEKNRRYLSGLHFMYGISSLLAPYLLIFIYQMQGTWKHYFIMTAFFPFLLLLFKSNEEKRKEHALNDFKNKKLRTPSRPFIYQLMITSCLAFYVGSEVLITSRLPLYLQNVHHFSAEKSQVILGYFFLGLLSGRLLFAYFNFSLKNIWLLFISLIGTFLIYIPSFFYHPSLFALCGLTMSFFFPCFISWLNEISGEFSEYMVSLALILVGIILVTTHWSFGFFSSYFGIHNAFYMIPILSFLAFFFLIIGHFLTKGKRSTTVL